MFINLYANEGCPVEPGIEWEDAWDCQCNDRCPACNAEIESFDSIEGDQQ